MGIAYFQKGAIVSIRGTQHLLKREVEEGQWQLEDILTGRLQIMDYKTIEALYARRELIFAEDGKGAKATSHKHIVNRPEADPQQWDKAKMKRAYVKAVMGLPTTETLYKTAIQAAWEQIQQPAKPPHWISVYRWHQQFLLNGNDAFALLDKHHQKGNKVNRYSLAVMEIVQEAIENIYLTRARKHMTHVLAHAHMAIEKENTQLPVSMHHPFPTRRLIQRLIQDIPEFDRWAARYGRTAAVRKYRAKLYHIVSDKRLENAEIDHTRLDLFVVDDETLAPLGRPWVTVCIDTHTRCILGVYIGFEPPSYLSVGRCLAHALKPKSDLQALYPSIRHPWLAFGVMAKLVVDNGLEFHSDALAQACLSLDIEIVYTPRKTPWLKGKVERFMRTLNEGVSYGTPGTTFQNIFEKDDYDPVKNAVVRLSTIREVIHKWICDVYHQKPHYGLDLATPDQMWQSSGSVSDTPVADDPGKIDILLGKHGEHRLDHRGIRINSLLYNSPEMVSLRKQYGDKLTVQTRIDEGNLGHIHVKHPDDDIFIKVPALHADYATGISLWQHELYRSYAKKHLKKDDVSAWAQGMVEIADLIAADLKLPKRKANHRIGRMRDAEHAMRQQRVKVTKVPENTPDTDALGNTDIVVKIETPVFMPVIQQRHTPLSSEGSK